MSGIFALGDPSYDIADAKMFTNDGAGGFGDLIDIPGVSLFANNFRVRSAEYRGDARLVAVASKLEAIEVTIRNLSVPLEMMEVFFGSTKESSGTGATRTESLHVIPKVFPWFGIVGKTFAGETTEGKLILVPYMKIMDSFEWRFEENQFNAPELKALALADPYLVDTNGDNFIALVRSYATLPAIAVPLPTS